MAKIIMEEQPDYAVLPADSIVDLKVEEVSVRENNGPRGAWTSVEFKFKVLGIQATGDGSPVEAYDSLVSGFLYGSCSARLTDNPENKLRQWCEAIFQMPLEVGFELDTDMLMGRAVRGITMQYENKQGFKRHKIDSLLPKAGGSPAASVPQPVAATAGSAAKDPWADWSPASQTDEPPF